MTWFAAKHLKFEGRSSKLSFVKMAGRMDIEDFFEEMIPYFGQSSPITLNR
jgi:hypothetical protein